LFNASSVYQKKKKKIVRNIAKIIYFYDSVNMNNKPNKTVMYYAKRIKIN